MLRLNGVHQILLLAIAEHMTLTARPLTFANVMIPLWKVT